MGAFSELKPKDLEKIRGQVLKKVHERVHKEFKPKAKAKITPETIVRVVDEAIKGCTTADIAIANEFSDIFCDKCGECCRRCNPIRVSLRDLLNIAGFLSISLARAGGVLFWTTPLGGIFFVLSFPNLYVHI